MHRLRKCIKTAEGVIFLCESAKKVCGKCVKESKSVQNWEGMCQIRQQAGKSADRLVQNTANLSGYTQNGTVSHPSLQLSLTFYLFFFHFAIFWQFQQRRAGKGEKSFISAIFGQFRSEKASKIAQTKHKSKEISKSWSKFKKISFGWQIYFLAL